MNNSRDKMKWVIRHQTVYKYTEKVFLEPHVLRFIPRPGSHVRIDSLSITTLPEPAGNSDIIENDGTLAKAVWFDRVTDSLEIKTDIILTIGKLDPFNFLIYPLSCARLPMEYPSRWLPLLTPYLGYGDEHPDIIRLAHECGDSCNFAAVDFIVRLCARIHNEFIYKKRENGPPAEPQETLRLKRGSCRDFAVLAMAACRCLGIACRYVSGYYLDEEDASPGDLHAWIEIFLPGAGWIGFDPGQGLACNNRHIALSASADPEMTMPVTGTFRGDASAAMSVDLFVKRSE